MPPFIVALIARFGAKTVGIACALLLAALLFGGWRLWESVEDWWQNRQLDKVTEQRDRAVGERDVARADRAQLERATDNTAATTAAQDAHLAETRADAATAAEVIDERIREVPVVVPVPDDPVVRQHAAAAVARARAADGRLRRAEGR